MSTSVRTVESEEVLADTGEHHAASIAADLWDVAPWYSVSRERMTAMRTVGGFLESIEIPFHYRGRQFTAVVHPARVKVKDGNRQSFYPSAREELIEHALRKLAVEQQAGFYDQPGYRSGVVFSITMLRNELEQQGHTLGYDEIVEALDILSLSQIAIYTEHGSGGNGYICSACLPSFAQIKTTDHDGNPITRWIAQFHPLMTRSMNRLTSDLSAGELWPTPAEPALPQAGSLTHEHVRAT